MAWGAYDGNSTRPLALVVISISRDADAHGVLEIAWADPGVVTEDIVRKLKTEMETWARENEILTMTAITARAERRMDRLLGWLGYTYTARVYGRQMEGER